MTTMCILPNAPNVGDFVDLHMHSYWSFDGFASLQEVLRYASERKLIICAVTDHDSVEVYEATGEVWTGGVPAVVSGVELTVAFMERTVGLLGIGIDPDCGALGNHLRRESQEDLREFTAWCVAVEEELGASVAQALRTWADRVFPDFPGRKWRYFPEWLRKLLLVDLGFVRDHRTAASLHEMVMTSIGSRPLLSIEDGIRLLHLAGGLCFFEHPDGLGTEEASRLAAIGIDGLEIFSGHLSGEEHAFWRAFCRDTHLAQIAGSDFHGVRSGYGRPGKPSRQPREVLDEVVACLARTWWGGTHRELLEEIDEKYCRRQP